MTGDLVLSKFNIWSRTRGENQPFILNLLSGHADMLSEALAAELERGEFSDPGMWREKGYLVNPEEEGALFRLKYLDYLDKRDKEEIQIFFIPGYGCNFSCSYCYQGSYAPPPGLLREEVTEAFFHYLDRAFVGRGKYITLFGGEPLLPGKKAAARIAPLIRGAARRGLDVAVVTNGYYLKDYLDLFSQCKIREVQVTLDGVGEVHDRRRFLKGGKPTFRRIVSGIDMALHQGVPINLRVVADRENLGHLPELAQFARERGWTDSGLFKTQLGRNYELHCHSGAAERLFSRLELYEELYKLIPAHPHILEFHRPGYSVTRFLRDNGCLPEPLFDDCPGAKSEWVFDYAGRIYACTATAGKEGEELGMFYPEAVLREEVVEEWRERDILTVAECRSCALGLVCGGGCGAVAKNKTGRLHAPDCRPVRELLEMGLSLYFQQGQERV